tara:strand:+ start:67 stop:378 length:312 start_codon:yes stop_codon:yes gene_type:complete
MDFKKKKTEIKKTFKINNENKNPLYKKIPCKCDKSNIEKSYPLIECIHCNCEKANNSIPDKPFIVNEPILDKNGKVTGTKKREVTEITLTNCEKYGSCIGWRF